MAALNHVCMWVDNQWKRVTAEEAARYYPSGTVSAKSGLFMCELCGQYVTLTDGWEKVRYFKHNRYEDSKDCPERTFASGSYISIASERHELPIRIRDISKDKFKLELGFIKVPDSLITADLRVKIASDSDIDKTYVYSAERFSNAGITYLPIGTVPGKKYKIQITGNQYEKLYAYWPKEVHGIKKEGTVFDAKTGKKLPDDADVVVGKKYWILKRGMIATRYSSHVTVIHKAVVSCSWETWYIYEVIANDYNEYSARFFLDYHCRLTEKPVEIQQVWPVYIENPYTLKHSRKSMTLLLKGNTSTVRVFPRTNRQDFRTTDFHRVLELSCQNQQFMISVGRTRVLQYTYFWQENLDQTTENPQAKVCDVQGHVIEPGINDELPVDKTLRIKVPYDGVFTVLDGIKIIWKQKLKAEEWFETDGIRRGITIQVHIGLDCIWDCSFADQKTEFSEEAQELLRRLNHSRGDLIPAPHALRSMASLLGDYPELRNWIYCRIREGYIKEEEYRKLQNFVLKINNHTGYRG